MTRPRHVLVDDEVVELKRRIAELEAAAEARKSVLTRRFIPRWAFILIVVLVTPLALYWGVEIGMSDIDKLFPMASVACH